MEARLQFAAHKSWKHAYNSSQEYYEKKDRAGNFICVYRFLNGNRRPWLAIWGTNQTWHAVMDGDLSVLNTLTSGYPVYCLFQSDDLEEARAASEKCMAGNTGVFRRDIKPDYLAKSRFTSAEQEDAYVSLYGKRKAGN